MELLRFVLLGLTIGGIYALVGEVGEGSRKDIRNAVEAATKAGKWAAAGGHARNGGTKRSEPERQRAAGHVGDDVVLATGFSAAVGRSATARLGRENLQPGDWLVVHTDGVTEARDANGAFFGEKRLTGAP